MMVDLICMAHMVMLVPTILTFMQGHGGSGEDTTQRSIISTSTIQYNTIQYNTVQCNTIQLYCPRGEIRLAAKEHHKHDCIAYHILLQQIENNFSQYHKLTRAHTHEVARPHCNYLKGE